MVTPPIVLVNVTPAPLNHLTPIPCELVGGNPKCLGIKIKHVITTQVAKQKSNFIDWPHSGRGRLW